MKRQDYKKPTIVSTSTEQVVFKDGMIVTAEHLQAAMHYPISLFQTLFRAFFGCGIVCGLKVDAVGGCESEEGKKNVWDVQISSGVAMDCQGYPLELCKSVSINLKPDPCSCDAPPTHLYIAIRRYVPEDSQIKPSCDGIESGQIHDPLKREQVMIKVFECGKLPENTCLRSPCDEDQKEDSCDKKTLCNCLKACPDHQCCGEGWVLLACIELGRCGIEVIDNSQRKYVKPIDCMCPPEEKVEINKKNGATPEGGTDSTQVASGQAPGKPKQGGKGK